MITLLSWVTKVTGLLQAFSLFARKGPSSPQSDLNWADLRYDWEVIWYEAPLVDSSASRVQRVTLKRLP